MINPQHIQEYRTSGNNSIDWCVGPEPREAFALLSVHTHFESINSGTGVAELVLSLDSDDGALFDQVLWRWANLNNRDERVGIGKDAILRVDPMLQHHWLFRAHDLLNLAWTIPTGQENKIGHGAIVRLIPQRFLPR